MIPGKQIIKMDDDKEVLIVNTLALRRNATLTPKARAQFHRTILTILLAAAIGFVGIWFVWSYGDGKCFQFDQDPTDMVQTCSPPPEPSARYNCWPQSDNVTEAECLSRQCCYAPVPAGSEAPICFYPANYQLYMVQSVKQHHPTGYYINLQSNVASGWPKDVRNLVVNISMETDNRIRFKVYDPNEKRFEVPKQLFNHFPNTYKSGLSNLKAAADDKVDVDKERICVQESQEKMRQKKKMLVYDPNERRYEVPIQLFKSNREVNTGPIDFDIDIATSGPFYMTVYDPNEKRYEVPIQLFKSNREINTGPIDFDIDIATSGPFYMTVKRKSTGEILFSTKGAAPLVFSDQFIQIGTKLTSKYIYGMGEHLDRYLLSTEWSKKVLWAFDTPPDPNVKDMNLYGVHPIYLNMEQSHKAHGVFLLNSNAMEVELQPEPSLTYRTIGGILDFYIFTGPTPNNVLEQYTGLVGRPFMPPYWALGFHLSRFGYANTQNLTKVIKRMREAKMYYDTQWTDIDAMRADLDWTYDSDGQWKGLDAVVKDLHDHGQHYNILVDPIITATKPNGTYLPLSDGLEKNVFVKHRNGTNLQGMGWPGNVYYIDWFNPNASEYWTKQAKLYHDLMPYDSLMIDMNEPSNAVNGSVDGCPMDSELENPPFVPRGLGGGFLSCRTLCASAKQHISTHYNVHSLYGYSQSVVTKSSLNKILGKRNIAIARSSFAGSGHFAGHWSGDVTSTWAQLNYTLTGMLAYSLYGVAFWGADVCGFGGVTTPEMCTRWTQLGAFYPFMFNHNEPGPSDQDPASFEPYYRDIMRNALELRYYLIPYLYTLFYRTHIEGVPVVRPLFFLYPNTDAYTVTEQFMWGDALLVTPALNVNMTQGMGYLPKDRWYNFYTHQYVDSPGHYQMFDLPLDTINVKVRGGSIIPMQTPEVTTTMSRKNKFILHVALAPDGTASGEIYWDDGEALDSISGMKYNLIKFAASKGILTSSIVFAGYKDEPMVLGTFQIFGVETRPTTVKLNDSPVESVSYSDKSLYISDLSVNLLAPISLTWV